VINNCEGSRHKVFQQRVTLLEHPLGGVLRSFVHENGSDRQSILCIMGEACNDGDSCRYDVMHVADLGGCCTLSTSRLVAET